MPFMGRLVETLITGGTIKFSTNIESYYLEAIEAMSSLWQLELVRKFIITPSENHQLSAETHFEKKYLQRGETCYSVIWRK